MFNDLIDDMDLAVRDVLGESVTITRAIGGEVLEGVSVVIDRGVPIDQGEAVTTGYTIAFWFEDVTDLAQGDQVVTSKAETFLVNRRLESDDLHATHILLKQ